MAVTMELGGVTLGTLFPLFERTFEFIRPDEQGPSFRRVKITLAGFLEGVTSEAVMALYQTLKARVGKNDTTFTYIDGATTIISNQKVFIQAYSEPYDTEFAKWNVGDYGIELYYFEDNVDTIGIACTYGAYTFDKVPKWGRSIAPNRETHRGELQGSTASITLSGFLFYADHTALMTEIEALQAAFQEDRLLTYGIFSKNVKAVRCDVAESIISQYAYYSIELRYDIGEIVSFRRKMDVTRVHHNPVITEEPFCNRRIVEFMNRSSQTITYSYSIESETVTLARTLLATEVQNTMEPGGVEMPGGSERWDYDRVSVDINIIKFYNHSIIDNLPGTGE